MFSCFPATILVVLHVFFSHLPSSSLWSFPSFQSCKPQNWSGDLSFFTQVSQRLLIYKALHSGWVWPTRLGGMLQDCGRDKSGVFECRKTVTLNPKVALNCFCLHWPSFSCLIYLKCVSTHSFRFTDWFTSVLISLAVKKLHCHRFIFFAGFVSVRGRLDYLRFYKVSSDLTLYSVLYIRYERTLKVFRYFYNKKNELKDPLHWKSCFLCF